MGRPPKKFNASVRPVVEINAFEPLPWQIAPWQDMSPRILLTGSAGGGKSKLAAEKIHGFCKKYKKATALIVRKTRESMENSTLLFLQNSVIGRDPNVRHSGRRFEYLDTGSVIAYGGMKDDAQREQVRGVGLEGGVDILWMEEANRFSETDFSELLGRMRGTAAGWSQMILTTNPDAPSHWINKRLILGGEAKIYYSREADNKYNPPEYKDRLAEITGVLRERLVLGKWVVAEGAVYSFDTAVHLVEHFTPPADWRRVRSIDFGYTNPFVCQWWAADGDGRMFLYRELYKSKMLVEDAAKIITDLSSGEKIEATVADHDAEDAATLQRHGIHTIHAVKEISSGIQLVQDRLRLAGDGKARLFVMKGSSAETDVRLEDAHLPTSTEEEFSGYAWRQARPGGLVKEEPLPVNNHGMDAMRYAVAYIDHNKGIETTNSEWSDDNTEEGSFAHIMQGVI